MLTQRDKNILPGGRDHETAMRLLNEPGAVLQWRNPEINNPCWSDWMSLCPSPFREDLEWRIKPKTLRYLICKWRYSNTDVNLGFAQDEQQARDWEARANFIEWIGDWAEVEV